MKPLLGALILLMGLYLLSWICYNAFVQTLPEAQGRNPILGILVGLAMVYVGQKWIRTKAAKPDDKR